MALTFKEIPDSRFYNGPSQMCTQFIAAPGTSDYPTGGYVIPAASVGLARLTSVFLAGLSGANGAGILFIPLLTQTNPPGPGVNTFNLIGYWTGAVVSTALAQITNGLNLSGVVFILTSFGYGG